MISNTLWSKIPKGLAAAGFFPQQFDSQWLHVTRQNQDQYKEKVESQE